ncbi:MAG: hypothetical protein CMB77_05770, partial [Euryarchaeota archaeon]|nr:hypothetical protein [Euryarchaeota archaeon]
MIQARLRVQSLSRPILLALLFFGPSMLVLTTAASSSSSSPTDGRTADHAPIDAPEWRIGDQWVYSSIFDAAGLVEEFGLQDSQMRTLYGDSFMWIDGIDTMDVAGVETLVYERAYTASYDSGDNGARLQGINGRLKADMQAEEILRVSDLAEIENKLTVDIEFCGYNLCGIGFAVREVRVIITSNYDPAVEGYDFPLNIGERHNLTVTTEQRLQIETDADDLQDIVTDETTIETENRTFLVVNQGPAPPPSSTAYTGCDNAYNITEFNVTTQDPESFEWWCPEAKNMAWNWQETFGLRLDFRLKSFTPSQSTGSVPTASAGQRDGGLEVTLAYPRFSPNGMLDVTVSATENGGSPLGGLNLEVRHEESGQIISLVTDGTGSATTTITTTANSDDSLTSFDMGSFGIVAWASSREWMSVATVTTVEGLVDRDIGLWVEGIIGHRIRDGVEQSLNELAIPFAGIPGDIIRLEVPVRNLGLVTNAGGSILSTFSNGTYDSVSVPSLQIEMTYFVSLTFTLPEPSSGQREDFGIEFLFSPSDPQADMVEENNFAFTNITIGQLPTANVGDPPSVQTFENITIRPIEYGDPDGGSIRCFWHVFYPEYGEVLNTTFESPSCELDWNWTDDGEWDVRFIAIDDEKDKIIIPLTVEVLNRPPSGVLLANLTQAVALKGVRIDLIDVIDLDTLPERNPIVSADWSIEKPDGSSLSCLDSKTYSCSFVPPDEGIHRVSASISDEDGALTVITLDMVVANAVPRNAVIEVFASDGSAIEPTEVGSWPVAKDQQILLKGSALDTSTDIDNLQVHWKIIGPDGNTTVLVGASREWNPTLSGLYDVFLEVSDEEGSATRMGTIDVYNSAPLIDVLTPFISVAEGTSEMLEVNVSDTATDDATLTICWDFDLTQDSANDADLLPTNDCDVEGQRDQDGIVRVYYTSNMSGYRNVTIRAVDADGVETMASIEIYVRNKAPIVSISPEVGVATVGEMLTLEAVVFDSADDLLGIKYKWDTDPLKDSDGNGIPDDDWDESTSVIRIQSSTIGQRTIRLVVV